MVGTWAMHKIWEGVCPVETGVLVEPKYLARKKNTAPRTRAHKRGLGEKPSQHTVLCAS